MHAISHTLAHRAPATRTRVRWQPYNSLQTGGCSSAPARQSPISYLNTPASSVSSSPPSTQPPPCEPERSRPTLPPPLSNTTRDSSHVREPNRSKYVIGLVDQAVKSLCEIWQPQDIPAVFMTSSRANVIVSESTVSIPPKSVAHIRFSRNNQLPSPVSPSTRPSPVSPPTAPMSTSSCEQPIASCSTNLVPLKGFVHEVLRRSRTSGAVLETALCYLEAIRSKVPDLVTKERNGEGVSGESEFIDRIIVGEESGNDISTDNSASAEDEVMDTIRVQDGSADSLSQGQSQVSQGPKSKKTPSPPLPPLPPLPSPLLCPRRAFLASLILASKFTQDRCYSNRAWAKLSGLPPREIGRCERALGDALQWRLWVGKVPASSSSSSGGSSNRVVARSRSEADLHFGSQVQQLSCDDVCSSSSQRSTTSETPVRVVRPSMQRGNSGLRRASTLPAEVFTTQQPTVCAASMMSFATNEEMQFSYSSSGLSLPSSSRSSFSLCSSSLSSVTSSMSSIGGSQSQSQFASWSQSQHHSGTDTIVSSPATPTLSYSPTSTASSSGGDRTIQMGFVDTTTPPFGVSGYASSWSGMGIAHHGHGIIGTGEKVSLPEGYYQHQPTHAALDFTADRFALAYYTSLE